MNARHLRTTGKFIEWIFEHRSFSCRKKPARVIRSSTALKLERLEKLAGWLKTTGGKKDGKAIGFRAELSDTAVKNKSERAWVAGMNFLHRNFRRVSRLARMRLFGIVVLLFRWCWKYNASGKQKIEQKNARSVHGWKYHHWYSTVQGTKRTVRSRRVGKQRPSWDRCTREIIFYRGDCTQRWELQPEREARKFICCLFFIADDRIFISLNFIPSYILLRK